MELSTGITSVKTYFLGRRRQILTAAAVLALALAGVTYYAVSVSSAGGIMHQKIAELKTVLRTNPHDVDARVALAMAYYQSGNQQEAISQLKKAIEINQSHQGALLLLGDMYMGQKKYQEAIPNYQKVVDANPVKKLQFPSREIQGAYYQLGSAYYYVNDFEHAAGALEDALGIDGSDSDAWYLLGKTYQNLSEIEKAVECLRKAVRFVPNFIEAYQALVQCYEKLGQDNGLGYAKAMVAYCSGSYKEAVTQLEKVTAQAPDFAEAYLGLGLAHEKLAEADEAMAAYRKVLDIDPENWLATAKLGK